MVAATYQTRFRGSRKIWYLKLAYPRRTEGLEKMVRQGQIELLLEDGPAMFTAPGHLPDRKSVV